MILSDLIAKILVLVEGFLDTFVTITPNANYFNAQSGLWTATGGSLCYNLPTSSGKLTSCGQELVGTLANLTDAMLQIFAGILPGLMVQGPIK